jgi:hypothetical protein
MQRARQTTQKRLGGEILAFLAASLALLGILHRDGLWGASVLAPLDIPFTLLDAYRSHPPPGFAKNLPENHYLIDQATYDLPVQYYAHREWQAGRFPWWNPHTYGGRPLAADAHANLFDPIRLLVYTFLPFLPAYAWTHILHSLLSGLGAFLLLRRFAPGQSAQNILLALTYQFCGPHALYQGHPWVQGSTLWLPWLWWTVHGLQAGRLRSACWMATASICGFVFSSNLQSYAYLPLFLLPAALLFPLHDRKQGLRLLAAGTCCGVAALGITSIAWVHVVELFFQSPRATGIGFHPRSLSTPLVSLLAAPLPWVLGTHETPDLSKLFGVNGTNFSLGFHCLVGTGLWAMLGGSPKSLFSHRSPFAPHARWAGSLFAGYLIVLGSPAASFLYARCAPIACLALIVMLRLRLNQAESLESFRAERRILSLVLLCSAALAVLASAWPHLPGTWRDMATEKFLRMNGSPDPHAPMHALRVRQMGSFAKALGLRSPHAASMLPFLLICAGGWRRRSGLSPRSWRTALLLAGLWQCLLFHTTHLTRSPASLFQALLDAPLPGEWAALRGNRAERIWEPEPHHELRVFPFEMSLLHGAFTSNGYAALHPAYTPKNLVSRQSPALPMAWVPMVASPLPIGGDQSPTLLMIAPGSGELEIHGLPANGGAVQLQDNTYPGLRFDEIAPGIWRMAYRPSHAATCRWLALGGALTQLGWMFAITFARRRKAPQAVRT